MPTLISKCFCHNEYQDLRYGRGNRLFNLMKDESKKMRCTICSHEKGISDQDAQPKKTDSKKGEVVVTKPTPATVREMVEANKKKVKKK